MGKRGGRKGAAMKEPDWATVDLDDGVLREVTPGQNRLVLWLPGGAQGRRRVWDRVGNLPGADVTVAQGLCATPATSVRVTQRARGFFGELLGRFRRSAEGRGWVLPNGEAAEQQGERQTDLVLVWPQDTAAPLAEEAVRARWPRGTGFRRLGQQLFLVLGVAPPAPGGGPLPPQACPKDQAEWLLASARRAGDRRREASALNDLGVVWTQNGQAARAVPLLEEALQIAAQVGDRALEGDVRGSLGLAVLRAGPRGRALELLGQALAQARANGDPYAEKAALDHLGTALSCLRDPGQALAAFGEALTLARALGDRRHEAEMLWQQAVQYADLGQRDEAVARGQAAVDLLGQMGHPHASWFADNLRKYRTGETDRELARAPAGSGGEIVIGAWSPQPEPARGPGLLRMAFSAAKSMAKFLMAGLKTVPAAERQRRLLKCATCAQHTGMRCRVCGCFTGAKAWLAHEQCPLGKWPV
jgi:tetratricopeptide (TPR) repeat protein